MEHKIAVVGIGAGTHTRSCLDALSSMESGYDVVGLIDTNKELAGKEVFGVKVLGGDDLLAGLKDGGVNSVFIGAVQLLDKTLKKGLFASAKNLDLEVINIIHASAVISPNSVIGEGVQIFAGAIINAGAAIGENVLINTGAIIEHDCQIGAHSQIAPGAILAGGATLGQGAFVGMGANVLGGIHIGAGAIVGAGAVVINDVDDGEVVMGVPARSKK